MKHKRLVSILRLASEGAALALFVFLFFRHRLQLWIIVFGASVLLSVIFGRFYCSWICPMNTAFRGINLIYRFLGIKRFKTPGIFRNQVVRIVILALFFGSMLIARRMGLKINPMLAVSLFAVLLTLFFEEAFWHRSLCPYGTILSFSSRKARRSLNIDEEACISCGKCQTVCPSESIITLDTGKRQNISHECLMCGNCRDVCPVSVCNFEIK